MKKLIIFKVLLVLVATALTASSAFARRSRARTMVDRMMRERETGRRYSQREIDYHQRRYETQVIRLLRRRSGLTSRELNMETLRDFVGRFEGNPRNIESITKLLENMTARGNVTPAQQQASANVLAQVMKLQKENGFMVEPRDILEVDRHWSRQEKDQLADVLLEARQIAHNEPGLSANKAFERALENRNMLERFRRRCR